MDPFGVTFFADSDLQEHCRNHKGNLGRTCADPEGDRGSRPPGKSQVIWVYKHLDPLPFLIVTPIMGFLYCFMFCCALLYVHCGISWSYSLTIFVNALCLSSSWCIGLVCDISCYYKYPYWFCIDYRQSSASITTYFVVEMPNCLRSLLDK